LLSRLINADKMVNQVFIYSNDDFVSVLHDLENQEYDALRTEYLEACGYRVLRFWNNQVLQELDFVLNVIYLALTQV
jgi:Protein of unknown function (DUF559)